MYFNDFQTNSPQTATSICRGLLTQHLLILCTSEIRLEYNYIPLLDRLPDPLCILTLQSILEEQSYIISAKNSRFGLRHRATHLPPSETTLTSYSIHSVQHTPHRKSAKHSSCAGKSDALAGALR